MDAGLRAEIEKLHGRITRLSERVVNLEAQQPHISGTLARIEKNVERLNGHLSKAVWIIFALFLTALWGLVVRGNLPI
jgi:chromosome segregation ATPase